ncbi:adhesin, partial [Klebsiella aerogenes]
TDALIATWVGAATSKTGWLGTVGWNAAGGATSSYIKGDDPMVGAITSSVGSGLGYGVGHYVVKPTANTIGKWITGGWNPKFDPTLLKYTEVKGQLGLSKEMVPSRIPGAIGNTGGSLSSEFGNSIIQKKKDAMETAE